VNPVKSLIARHQNKTLKNFYKTKYGQIIKSFKDKHKGKRCFVLGNGPSLSAADLNRLKSADEITFATNRVFKIFEQTDWRPTYYVSEDELILKDTQADVNKMKAFAKFVPIQLKYYHDINIDGAVYFNLNYDSEDRCKYNFSPDFAAKAEATGTVTITCLQLAAYMGFSEIYLLGVDHNFSKIIDENGNEIIDNTVKDYFVDGYDDDVKSQVVHDLGTTTKGYQNAKNFCDENGIKVFNATRGGKLEVFKRADFDSLF
jgi:hypothetical protein